MDIEIETEKKQYEECKIQSQKKIRFLAVNINGFPSKKANRHKIKMINELLHHRDVGIFIETGINEDNKPTQVHDDYIYPRHNEQINKGNAQYQHNGKGTLIASRKNINT